LRNWSIRWLLLGVSAAVILLPALSLLLLRSYTGYLVRRTEEQLLGQGVLIAEAYRDAWRREALPAAPHDAPEPTAEARYAPFALQAEHLRELSPPEPKQLPHRPAEAQASPETRAGRAVEPLLRRAQVHNLSAIRLLDANGCVVATTRGDAERCLRGMPEVERALGGSYAAVLRARVSDEPPPALSSLSRRGDQRLFIALPVSEKGRVIGVVRLSRTAESGLEWLWKNRLPFLGGAFVVVLLALLLSLVSASFIARPLERLARAASRVSSSGRAWPERAVGRAPRELVVLGHALEAMANRLAARAEYVAEFAANVSHELKTPLTSIRGAAELLRDDWARMSEAQRQRFLANIQADAERTETLVGDLLRLARIESTETVAPAETVELGVLGRELALRYPEHVALEIEAPEGTVSIPREQAASALGNLVDNALRYRREAPVRVRLSARGGRFVAEVEDDGPGISAANLPRVFERFFTTERDRGGTGLGLAIVRAIAESRGGSATCESRPGKTVFRLAL
jgi:signal transduction histidine kinase